MAMDVQKSNPANFVWYEFHTPDAATAESFYNGVFGWEAHDAGMPNRRYTLLNVDGIAIGGLLEKPANSFLSGAKPGWMGYIGVVDLDASLKKLQKANGIVHRATETIPGIGRFAVVADPQGAIFVLFQPADMQQMRERAKAGRQGTPAWHELAAIDWQSDFTFYSEMFGWSKADAIEMPSHGVYQIFASGDQRIGGMMTRMDPSQNPGWVFYFHIDEIASAMERVRQNGGTIVSGPMVVPGGQQAAFCLDPQGAPFGIVTPKS